MDAGGSRPRLAMTRANEASFEAVAVPHLEAVYRVARRLTRDDHEAEDLVQETYLKAFRAYATFQMREFGIRPWLLKILSNTFLNRRARDANAPRATDQQVLDAMATTPDATAHVAPPVLDYENLDEEVKQAMNGLPPEFRAVLSLWATMEYSYQEIADILDVPIGTVMSRLYRARQQLATSLQDFAQRNGLLRGRVAT